MRYRLRTLMIVLALGPPVLAAWYLYTIDRAARRKIDEQFRNAYDKQRLNNPPRLIPEISDKSK